MASGADLDKAEDMVEDASNIKLIGQDVDVQAFIFIARNETFVSKASMN